jgi:hypothetical protein
MRTPISAFLLMDRRSGPLDTTLRWDGRTRSGIAAAGVYFAVLETDGATVSRRRLVLVK